ncbi:hypothetical protein OY671_008407, partial [Metschnikowia pulcherrima]
RLCQELSAEPREDPGEPQQPDRGPQGRARQPPCRSHRHLPHRLAPRPRRDPCRRGRSGERDARPGRRRLHASGSRRQGAAVLGDPRSPAPGYREPGRFPHRQGPAPRAQHPRDRGRSHHRYRQGRARTGAHPDAGDHSQDPHAQRADCRGTPVRRQCPHLAGLPHARMGRASGRARFGDRRYRRAGGADAGLSNAQRPHTEHRFRGSQCRARGERGGRGRRCQRQRSPDPHPHQGDRATARASRGSAAPARTDAPELHGSPQCRQSLGQLCRTHPHARPR